MKTDTLARDRIFYGALKSHHKLVPLFKLIDKAINVPRVDFIKINNKQLVTKNQATLSW
jgi:hypothetical protein